MGLNLNPLDAIRDVTETIGAVAVNGAEAFGDALNVARRTVDDMSISDIGHLALDVAGMVPVIGEAADLANAGWYAAEGDFANAALSGAAAIPFAGNLATGAKWINRGVEAADTISDGVRVADNAGGVVRTADAGALPPGGAGAVTPTAAAPGAAPPVRGGAEPALVGAGAPSRAVPARAEATTPGGAGGTTPAGATPGGATPARGADGAPAGRGGTDGPDGPSGPNGPEGGKPPEPEPDGSSYRTDLPQHLRGPDGFSGTRLNGTHNQDVAISEVSARGFTPTVHPTGTPGINRVEWKVPDPNNPGETITRTKTTYDPKVYDDQQMLDMAQGAGGQAWARDAAGPKAGTDQPQSYDVTQDGVNFRVYVTPDGNGNRYISNVHPV